VWVRAAVSLGSRLWESRGLLAEMQHTQGRLECQHLPDIFLPAATTAGKREKIDVEG
jgi:hypothetical protein